MDLVGRRIQAPGNGMMRCDLCGKMVHSAYQVGLDGMPYHFCSGLHTEMAAHNFEENKKKGITKEMFVEHKEVSDDLEPINTEITDSDFNQQ
jgi:YHS domain-containing protein